jgi:hypothetical protein
MNKEPVPINFRAEQKKFCENINTVVLGIKYVALGIEIHSSNNTFGPTLTLPVPGK